MSYNTYLLLSFIGFGLSILASIFTSVTFNRYKGTPAARDITPADFAKEVSDRESLGVNVQLVQGQLADHYDPRDKTVRLSAQEAYTSSISQLAVTAHEMGHALQHHNGGIIFMARTALAAIVGFSTNIGYFLVIIGLAISWLDLAVFGLILFSATTIFMLLTLPIEIDASIKGMKLLHKYGIITSEESGPAAILLTAAASTYLVALLQSLLQFMYFASLVSGRRRSE